MTATTAKACAWFKALDEKQRRALVVSIFILMSYSAAAAVGVAENLAFRECVKHYAPETCR
jgi:hypothetical protein